MRKIGAGLLLLIAGGCGGGGGSRAPVVVSFGIVAGDAPTVREVLFPNPLPGPSHVENGVATGPFEVAEGQLPALAPGGGDYPVRVRFEPPGPGKHEGSVSLRFTPTGGGSPIVVEMPLAATAEEARPSMLTKSLDFGEVIISERATRRMTIANLASKTACRLSAPAMPAAFSIPGTIFPLRIGAQETVTLDLEYAPTALGIPAFDLVFAHDGTGAPLRIPVTATTSTWPQEMVVDLGDVVLDEAGDTPWLEVETTPHTVSLTVEATATTAETIEIVGLEWPGGFAPSLPPWGLPWPTIKRGIRSVTIPWTDMPGEQLAPGAGTYRFRFRRETGTAPTLRVRAIVENRPGAVVSGGVLDLNVFLIVNPGWTPEMAKANSQLQAALAGASTILSTVGLTVGDVAYYGIANPDYQAIGAFLDPTPEMYQLLAESAAAVDTRLNLFYVGSVSGPLGVAGMIQGPAANGWPESGVIVTAFDAGNLTAHEIGHYLGLHHTGGDAISDTGPLTTGNVMSPSTAGAAFSPGQGHVILRHPLVRSP